VTAYTALTVHCAVKRLKVLSYDQPTITAQGLNCRMHSVRLLARHAIMLSLLCIARTVVSQDVRPSVCRSVCHTPVYYV